MGIFDKMKKGLKKTQDNMVKPINEAFKEDEKITDDLFEKLEEIMIMADVGMDVTLEIISDLKKSVKQKRIKYSNEAKKEFKEILKDATRCDEELKLATKPAVILVIGVNGVGKTTTIGKLSHNFTKQGKKVMLAAADTFRAAAIEQLEIWGERSNAKVIKNTQGSDPAAVVYDALVSAKNKKADIVICDTAGRLHNKKNLMNELEKIKRIIDKEAKDCDKEFLLVIDAQTGQNGVIQALEFKEIAGITGIILTKLDGTAKGGIVISIKKKLGIPIRYVGLGEGIDDLEEFDPQSFIDGLFLEEGDS